MVESIELVIVGAGPAGLAASAEAAELGVAQPSSTPWRCPAGSITSKRRSSLEKRRRQTDTLGSSSLHRIRQPCVSFQGPRFGGSFLRTAATFSACTGRRARRVD